MGKHMVTTGDVARALGVTINTVKAWIARGVVEAVRLPSGHYRVPAAELDRLVEEGSAAPSYRKRARQWELADDWARSRAAQEAPVAEALAWVDGMLRIARSHGNVPEPSVEETVERVGHLHRALARLR